MKGDVLGEQKCFYKSRFSDSNMKLKKEEQSRTGFSLHHLFEFPSIKQKSRGGSEDGSHFSHAAIPVKTSPSLFVVYLFNFHFFGTTDDGSVPLVASPASEAGVMWAGDSFTA